VIDTDRYMTWLRFTVACRGGKFVNSRIDGDLFDQEDALLKMYDVSAIVNATGLSGFDLAGDKTVYPLRGALIRVVNDGSKFPLVTEALCVTHDDERGAVDDIVFIVPRNDRTLILGGKHIFTSEQSNAYLLLCELRVGSAERPHP
jgi:D-amino-acid oxidase